MTQAIINCTNVTQGSIRPDNAIWNTVRGSAAGTVYDTILRADNQWTTGDKYWFHRGVVQFDTSSIPSGALLGSAVFRFPDGLYVWNAAKNSMAFALLSGMPTYPSNPVVYADFALAKYPNLVLWHDFTGLVWNGSAYVYDTASSIDVFRFSTAAELAYIQKGAGAVTKFCLVTEYDYNNSPPGASGLTQHFFKSHQFINSNAVQLVIDYVLSPQVVRTDKPSSIS
jgi:hypothetical protein